MHAFHLFFTCLEQPKMAMDISCTLVVLCKTLDNYTLMSIENGTEVPRQWTIDQTVRINVYCNSFQSVLSKCNYYEMKVNGLLTEIRLSLIKPSRCAMGRRLEDTLSKRALAIVAGKLTGYHLIME